MPISPVTIFDTYSRSVASGWGTADSGHTWNSSPLSLSVAGGRGLISSPANSGKGVVSLNLGNIPRQGTNEILTRLSWSGSAAWPLTNFGPVLNNTQNKDYYGLALQGNYAEVAIIVYSNGVRYEMNRVSASLTKDQEYWVRFRVTDRVYGKIWREGDLEPTSWTITSTLWDGSKPIGAGGPGFFKEGTRDAHTIRISQLYYYTLEDEHPNTYPLDHFNRSVSGGWGRSGTGHVWEGATQADPQAFNLASLGSTNTSSGGTGVLPLQGTNQHFMSLGQSFSAAMQAYTTFNVQSASGQANVRLGLRGSRGYQNGRMVMSGYALLYNTASNTISIQRRSTLTGTWTTLATSSTLSFTHGAIIRLRFEASGTTLRGKIWDNGQSEPSSYQVTATDNLFSSGSIFIEADQSSSVARTVEFYQVQYSPVPPPSPDPQNYIGQGTLILTQTTDTGLWFDVTYTDDANNNAGILFRYKEATSNTWSAPAAATMDHPNKKASFVLSGLRPETTYNIEVIPIDFIDGVSGLWPLLGSYTTSTLGIVPQAIRVVDIDSNSATIEATYAKDSNNTSTAVLHYRVSNESQRVVDDSFVDVLDTTLLQNVETNGNWIKHIPVSGATQAVVEYGRVYPQTATETDKILYYHSQTLPSSEYDVVGSIYTAHLNGIIGVAARVSSTTETYYGAGLNGNTYQWEIFKMQNGTKTILSSADFDGEGDRIYTITFLIRSGYKALVVDGIELLRTTDNTLTGGGNYVGLFGGGVINGKVTNQVVLDAFQLRYRTATGSWINAGAMSVNRTTRTFSKLVTGLAGDTVYEFRATFSDAGGVHGPTELSTTSMTVGRAVFLSSMGATSHQTTVELDVLYDYDVNDDSYLQVQYRSTMEVLWFNVPYSRIVANRTMKKFSVTIDGLRPHTTYEVRVFIFDPDGLIENSPSQLAGLFTTEGPATEDQIRSKHYVWKVYDPDEDYFGTLPVSPEPIFSLHENGGVTDLSFELPMKLNDVGEGTIINFQNRVDIWAIDPSSSGMGPNLISDPDCDADVGGWVVGDDTYGQNAAYDPVGGPDDGSALKITSTDGIPYETISNPVELHTIAPFVIECVALAKGASLRMYAKSYNRFDEPIDTSDEVAETIGTDWQKLKIQYEPPANTEYIRVFIRNTGRGSMWADKFSIKSKESLIYRGRIESFTPSVDASGERVNVQALGLSSLLSDDYIEFLQFVEVQPQKDVEMNRPNNGAADPADMMKRVIDLAAQQNPIFNLYYTTESIRSTGTLAQYTFRDQQIRSCLDRIRTLCPSGWHYFIGADGLVTLRGPEHAQTHYLRMGVEVLEFEVEKSIRNLKNYIRVKGRQDEDKSEADGHGSINYIAFDQASIDKYGKRTLFIRDAQLTDPDTAKLVGDGRLDEVNREEQRVTCKIPDEKIFKNLTGSLIGYNIESFLPGDNIVVVDPIGGPRSTFWDRFIWDKDGWDSTNDFRPLPTAVPIKTVEYRGDRVELSLSERPPSQVGDFARLSRWMANQDRGD